jgi:hypothetical protein
MSERMSDEQLDKLVSNHTCGGDPMYTCLVCSLKSEREMTEELATALINGAYVYEGPGNIYSGGSVGLGYEGWICNHCDGIKNVEMSEFVHDLTCPVLVAQDMLTGVKAGEQDA